VAVQVDGLDRTGLLSDVTRVLSDQRLNILSAAMNATKDRVFRVRLTFETPDPTHLEHVLASIRRVSGVYDVYRIKQ
jgi:GTP pyrophosphokinase